MADDLDAQHKESTENIDPARAAANGQFGEKSQELYQGHGSSNPEAAGLQWPPVREPRRPLKAHRLLRAMMRTAVACEVVLRNRGQVERAGVERGIERPIPPWPKSMPWPTP